MYLCVELVTSAEAEFEQYLAQFKGHQALTGTFNCFFLRTVERFNLDIVANVKAPVSSHHALFMEQLVSAFQSLRAAEVTAMRGYTFQATTILRNVYDNCVFASAAVQNMTDFERLAGVVPGEPFDVAKFKSHRKKEERRVRDLMDGKGSGLSTQTLNDLRLLGDNYDSEVHGSRLTLSQNMGWLKGQESLSVVPTLTEDRVAIFMNRHTEVCWLVHRMMPLMQVDTLRFQTGWGSEWSSIDDGFDHMLAEFTRQLKKTVGDSFREFVKAKFPFDIKSHL